MAGTDPFAPPELQTWRTGTAIDEFTPIYLALATATKHRPGIPPGDAAQLDLTIVAALLGVGSDPFSTGDVHAAGAAINAERLRAAAEGRVATWDGGTP